MKRGEIDLDEEGAFYLYHLICTYTTGDYPQPHRSKKEAAREVANRIRTGCETLEYNHEEYLAVAKSFTAEDDVPVSYSDSRGLFGRIIDNAPKRETTNHVYYGPNWEDIRKEVLQRDGYQCRRCDETQTDHKKRVGHSLHIHHITPSASSTPPREQIKKET
jgi:hypothetical protein